MPQVARDTVRARATELRGAVAEARQSWLATLVGRPLRVLVERDGTGHAENFARVAAPPGHAAGTIATITPSRIEDTLLV